uniref:Uncharacterized protein n=1 Tax=Timema shepardi TaxID=629360 RepID=A0A7R9FXK3_TIMSH|nr:unnamed protein product [Timema shepardi]
MTEALKASFASWEKEQLRLNIVKGGGWGRQVVAMRYGPSGSPRDQRGARLPTVTPSRLPARR